MHQPHAPAVPDLDGRIADPMRRVARTVAACEARAERQIEARARLSSAVLGTIGAAITDHEHPPGPLPEKPAQKVAAPQSDSARNTTAPRATKSPAKTAPKPRHSPATAGSRTLRIGRRIVPMTTHEMAAIEAALTSHVERHGTVYGFVAALLDRNTPAACPVKVPIDELVVTMPGRPWCEGPEPSVCFCHQLEPGADHDVSTPVTTATVTAGGVPPYSLYPRYPYPRYAEIVALMAGTQDPAPAPDQLDAAEGETNGID